MKKSPTGKKSKPITAPVKQKLKPFSYDLAVFGTSMSISPYRPTPFSPSSSTSTSKPVTKQRKNLTVCLNHLHLKQLKVELKDLYSGTSVYELKRKILETSHWLHPKSTHLDWIKIYTKDEDIQNIEAENEKELTEKEDGEQDPKEIIKEEKQNEQEQTIEKGLLKETTETRKVKFSSPKSQQKSSKLIEKKNYESISDLLVQPDSILHLYYDIVNPNYQMHNFLSYATVGPKQQNMQKYLTNTASMPFSAILVGKQMQINQSNLYQEQNFESFTIRPLTAMPLK